MCLLAVPLGLGAGSVDTALNNFVALHYKVRHMNWLHCFWGVGATVGPIIMSAFLATKGGWRMGYGTIGLIQTVLVVVLFATLPLWKRAEDGQSESGQASQALPTMRETLRTPGVRSAMLGFFAYCALELTTGLWGSSYLVIVKGISAETAAQWISFYYFGITAGRFATGFLSFKLCNNTIIRLGMGLIAAGLAAVLLPFGNIFLQIGFALIGIGCAPIFPGMIHETPLRFGSSLSQRLIGLQMASAYAGSTFMPLLFGAIAQAVNIALLPYFLVAMFGLMVFFSENVNRLVARSALEKA
jgi:fucose permease